MSKFGALVRRELAVYYVSPMAYIILTAFLEANGFVFWYTMTATALARSALSFAQIQQWMVYLLTLITPLITMRLIAEEKSRGTIETMMTAPVSEWSFVLAKYTASLLFVCYLLFPTVCYVVLAAKYGDVDAGAIFAGYLGILLAIAAMLAIGTLISAMAASQITAGVITLVSTLMLMMVSLVAPRLPEGEWWSRIARDGSEHINIIGHMESFTRGIVDSRSTIYLMSVVFLFLFLTVKVIDSRRWR